MFTAKSSALASFLRESKPDLTQISEFLTTQTFREFGAIAIFICVVRPTGGIFYPTGFGYREDTFYTVPERSIDTDSPATNMLRTGEIAALGAFEDYPFTDARNARNLFPDGFASSFAFPFVGFGGAVAMCSQEIELDGALKNFFHEVGLIVGLYCSVTAIADVLLEPIPQDQPALLLTLTHRQWTVLEEIQKGCTNVSIAHKLGYSESTIRHETMRIYKKLNVRGRADLVKRDF